MAKTESGKCAEIFPSRLSAIIFVVYMALFVNQGLLVTATKTEKNKYSYNTTTVVLLTECLKLIAAIFLYMQDHSLKDLYSDILINKKVLLLYMVPAFLYCLYNNLTFVNLAAFDPTTYFILMQLRVVITGIVFQILFKKQLSSKQWGSLILLTVGCIIKQLQFSSSHNTSTTNSLSNEPNSFFKSFNLSFNLVLILVQVFCSCFAGVYNEYLLKDVGAQTHLMVQNIFMYLDSIVCNVFVLLAQNEVKDAFSSHSLSSVMTPLVIGIMINNAGCGLVTSLFLKNLNSILKTFASALELIFTAVLSWMLFGVPVDIMTAVSIGVISYAIYLYSLNPVVNKPSNLVESKEDEV